MPTLPQVSGPTEHALRALLDRELASSRIPDYLGWVCLNFSTATRARSDLEAHLEQATKSTPEQAAATVDGLIALGLLAGTGEPTSEGQAELMSTRQRVKATTDHLTAGLSEDEVATAIGVLDHVRGRAEAILKS